MSMAEENLADAEIVLNIAAALDEQRKAPIELDGALVQGVPN
jgi:hypothetical protein